MMTSPRYHSTSPDAAKAERTIDNAISSPRAAMLTRGQFEEVERLRTRFDHARAANDMTECLRIEALILSIIREGPARLG